MPFIICSTATASQIFIKREPATHAYLPGKEIDRVEIKGGAGLQKEQRIYAETGKRVPGIPEECDFAVTVISDGQMEWLQQETAYQAMVKKGFLRAVSITEKEAQNMKPYQLVAECEHLVPVMATDKGKQLTAEDFAGSLAKVAVR